MTRLVSVIISDERRRGTGTKPDDLVRQIRTIHTVTGGIIAEHDPLRETDGRMGLDGNSRAWDDLFSDQ